MKNAILGLMAATLIATPAFANSWKTQLFTKLDTDISGEISITELSATGCKFDRRFFKYSDADRSNGLNKSEFFQNRDFFSRCK
jgi:hypothetical protein